MSRAPALHVHDAGIALDRARILVGAALEEIARARLHAPRAGELAAQASALRAALTREWEELPEPELPLEHAA